MLNRRILASFILTAALLPAKSTDPNNPTGTTGVVLIDKMGRHIRFFDPKTWTETGNIEVGINPHDIALSPDHKTAYVPIYGAGIYGRNPNPGHTIAIIDLISRTQTGTIDVSPYVAPHGIQIDAAGTLYVTCDASRKLLIIDPKTRAIKDAIDTEGTSHWVAVLPNATKAYLVNKNDRPFITVIDLKTRKIATRISVPNGTEGVAASPDGKRVLALDYKDPVLHVIDPATDKIVEDITLQGNNSAGARVRFSPDGSKIVTDNSGRQLVNILSASDLHGRQLVVPVGKAPMGVGFAPDNRTLLVGNHGDGSVSVIDMQDGKELKRFHAGAGIETMTWY
ncbi:MAG TPA: cytochrome D1 domain-containing protein [Bryobacteraceae bacterium]|jgi:DNA-binding beta-propeller fold protein YncE|nr:cytochrome D1 domain-containing protein [Bryobacteraceae bacterium]